MYLNVNIQLKIVFKGQILYQNAKDLWRHSHCSRPYVYFKHFLLEQPFNNQGWIEGDKEIK